MNSIELIIIHYNNTLKETKIIKLMTYEIENIKISFL